MSAARLWSASGRRWAVALAAVVVFAAAAAGGYAYYVAHSAANSNGRSAAGSVGAPGGPAVPAYSHTGTVHVAWAAATLESGAPVQGYYVTRSDDQPVCGSLGSPVSGLSCDDTGVADGTYSYTVTAVFHEWTHAATTGSVLVDTVAPAPTVTSPAAYVDSTTPTISGTAGTRAADSTHSADNPTVDVTIYSGPDTSGSVVQSFSGVAVSSGSWTVSESALAANAQYTVKVSQGDAAGNDGSGTRTFVVDTVSPNVSLGPTGVYSATNEPTFSGAAGEVPASPSASADSATVRLKVCPGSDMTCGSPTVLTTTESGGTWSITPGAPLGPDGTYTAQAYQSDGAGNTGSSVTRTFLIDTTRPSSSATGNDSNWHNAAVTVHLSATDPNGADGSGVASITYTVDGGAPTTVNTNAADVTISAPADHSKDGSHTIAFSATDKAGNQESPANQVTVKIDTTKPQTAPTGNDSSWHKAPVTVHLAASDPGYATAGSGVTNLHYQVDAQTAIDAPGSGGVAGADVTIPAPADGSNDGTHTITYQSTDAAGNVESQGSVSVKIDATKPTSAVTFPANGGAYNNAGWTAGCSTTPFNVANSICGTAGDTTSGVSAVRVSIQAPNGKYWNGTDFNTASSEQLFTASGTSNWTLAFPASNFATAGGGAGAYTVRSYATDSATNTQAATTSTFTLDNSAPTLQSLQMFDTDHNGKVDQIKATFNENLNASYGAPATVWTLTNAPGGSGNTVSGVSISGAVATIALNEGVVNTAPGTYTGTTLSQFTLALAANASGIRDAAGNQASFAATTVADKANPVAVGLSIPHGNSTPGKGDTVAITFSEPLAVASLCSGAGAWSGNTTSQVMTGNNVVTVRVGDNTAPTSGNDLLSVLTDSTHCGGSPHFGTVDLGSKSYNTSGANIDFKGTGNGGNASEVDWTFSSLQLTFTLGTTSGSPAAVAQNLTATYAVDSAMTDIAGNAAAGTASDTSTGTSFHF